jgi:hypothetical protein
VLQLCGLCGAAGLLCDDAVALVSQLVHVASSPACMLSMQCLFKQQLQVAFRL